MTTPEGVVAVSREQQPAAPTELERWVGDGGWFVEVLLPRTDAGVLVQAVVLSVLFALLVRPARRAGLLQLWTGGLVLTAGLFMLRAAH